ncbi:hypothetical protein SAMN05444722_2365 [Rhodovulum sp. ES.010]|uniref:hypothetical protein n=1 Tax=Rhodovulum sp. ES.010 TaxID=1882821 RepID=UPI000929FAE0|nr:hypothetical protein [Rhodovulum sp. ES.010]SIO46938.1 hypothetical protein SAMN05444722_2365 [Rhodovulum sp. ES.010]
MFDPTKETPPEADERAVARFRADRGTYIKAHLLLALVGGAVATAVLAAIGNPHPWVGIVAAVLGVGVRGAYLMSEELSAVWTLTDRALVGPDGRRVLLENVEKVRKLGSAAQVITRTGDKHLIKFLADPDAVRAQIDGARGA